MYSKLVLAAGAAALLAAGTAWGADGFTLKGPPKAAFLYFKAKNDGGWTQAFRGSKAADGKSPGSANSLRGKHCRGRGANHAARGEIHPARL